MMYGLTYNLDKYTHALVETAIYPFLSIDILSYTQPHIHTFSYTDSYSFALTFLAHPHRFSFATLGS